MSSPTGMYSAGVARDRVSVAVRLTPAEHAPNPWPIFSRPPNFYPSHRLQFVAATVIEDAIVADERVRWGY